MLINKFKTMNYPLKNIPQRSLKPRHKGITMVMDKGDSLQEAENFVENNAPYVDFVKLGFGTSMFTNKLNEKIKVYKNNKIKPYFGGTLFEAFWVRGQIDDFKKYVNKYNVDTIEVSDGAITVSNEDKCALIRDLSKDFYVISEVGSKDASVESNPTQWGKMMQQELEAGSEFVIAEARESGNVGVFDAKGKVQNDFISEITKYVTADKILWEAPQKAQQVWFIKQFGYEVNLGNIAYNEVLPLETLRTGLRGDTFFDFLPK